LLHYSNFFRGPLFIGTQCSSTIIMYLIIQYKIVNIILIEPNNYGTDTYMPIIIIIQTFIRCTL